MPNTDINHDKHELKTPNAHKTVTVSALDLPLHCPQAGSSLWDSHPKVYIPIEDAQDKRAICPYCGTEYLYKG